MADNTTKIGANDRRRVSSQQGYEISYFARKHGLTKDQARDLIARIGNDRAKLNAAASKIGR